MSDPYPQMWPTRLTKVTCVPSLLHGLHGFLIRWHYGDGRPPFRHWVDNPVDAERFVTAVKQSAALAKECR